MIYILVRSDNKQYDCPHQTNTSCVWYSDNSKDRLRWNMPYSMGILVSNEITKDQVITTFVQDTESIGMSLHAIVWQWTNLTLTELRKHQVLYPRKLLMLLYRENWENIRRIPVSHWSGLMMWLVNIIQSFTSVLHLNCRSLNIKGLETNTNTVNSYLIAKN